MAASSKHPLLRRSLVVFAFLGLAGLFFALHFFLYIPRQEEIYNNKVFRILSEISRDLNLRIEGAINKEIKTAKKQSIPDKSVTTIAGQLDSVCKHELLQFFGTLNAPEEDSEGKNMIYTLSKNCIKVSRAETSTNTLNRQASNKEPSTDTSPIMLHIDSMLRPNYEQLHHNLFRLLLLVKRSPDTNSTGKPRKAYQDEMLYRVGDLSTRYAFEGDSLFKDKQYGHFATIHDIVVQGKKFKAFCQPFQLPNSPDELLLIGLVPGGTYRAETAEFPLPAILTIGVLLAIVMLSLPVIKLAMCSRNEQVSINAVRSLMVVFLATPFLATLAAGSIYVYQYADELSTNTLNQLHKSVERQLQCEVDAAYRQLFEYELMLDTAKAFHTKTTNGTGTSNRFRTAMDQWLYPWHYNNLTDFFWTNAEGLQIGKWVFTDSSIAYLDLGKRDFFQVIKKHVVDYKDTCYRYIEPTISWATGNYTINMVKGSKTVLDKPRAKAQGKTVKDTAMMAGIAARLHSVCDPVLPKGYQFAYINRQGKILFHSQTMRALHENLLEEAGNDHNLVTALNNGDSTILRSVTLFDHTTKMLISPSRVMPQAFVVTYYQEREQNLFVLHIMMFAFFCTSGTLLLFLLFNLLKHAIIKLGQIPNIYRYPTSWMQPAANKMGFYKIFGKSQLCLLGVQMLMAILCSKCAHGDELLLMQCTLLPFEVGVCYYLLRIRYSAKHNVPAPEAGVITRHHQQLIALYSVFILPLIGLFFLKLDQQASIAQLLLLILLSASIGPALGLSMPVADNSIQRATPPTTDKHSRKFEGRYLLTLLSSIVMIAVLPTIGFMLYAFKQERQLQTETEQVTAAHALVARQAQLDSMRKLSTVYKVAPEQISKMNRRLDTAVGIYLPTQTLTVVQPDSIPAPVIGERPSQSHIYRIITRFLFLPDDHADFFNNNQSIYWNNDRQQTMFYRSADTANKASFKLNHHDTLAVYPTLNCMLWNMQFVVLCIAFILFFVILVQLIKGMVHRVFLLNLFPATAASLDDGLKTETEKNRHQQQDIIYRHIQMSDADRNLLELPKGFITHKVVEELEKKIRAGHRDYAEILHLEYLLAPAFAQVWGALTEQEQLVLYDFALDGITNYRNSDIIYKLYQTGLLVRKQDGHLELMSQSFRRYLLNKAGSDEVKNLEQQFQTESSWKNLKNFSYMLFFAVMVFLFATQQDLSNKVIAIISGLATVIPLMVRLFDRNVPTGGNKS